MPQTGATRYQKFLKSEKSKTKLKAKKDLPKGTNVTKTNFKIKKIVIREQLKKHSDNEALSTRKLNITELLSRLNHFNTNSRTDALQGLKDLVIGYPQVLERNLGQLIHGVTPLILNIEKVVRKDTLQVLQAILTNASTEKIDPFYEVMSTYLRSAMTHIDTRIQEDSLLFLDVLLLCTPNKLAHDFHKVIPNFLDMISKLRVDSKPGRTLTVNLGSQITSVKWRVKVLHRLQVYLNKYVQHKHLTSQYKDTAATTKSFDVSQLNFYPLFNPSYTSVCRLACFSPKNALETTPDDEVGQFMEYIDTLMPLLFETWREVCPDSGVEQNMETFVNEDAASLLKHTLEVIHLIWVLVLHLNKKSPSLGIQHLFCQKYNPKFTHHFVKMFPFVTNMRTKQKNENAQFENVVTDPKLVAENLEICHLFILINPNINIKKNNSEMVSILHYIEKIFNHNVQESINNVVLTILHTIFSDKVNNWTKTLSVMDALFRKIIWAYFNKPMQSGFKQEIFRLLCMIALNDRLSHFHQSEAFDMWLKNLPDILLEDRVNVQTINIIHKFAVRNNKTFNAVVKPKLLKFLQNMPLIKVIDAVHDTNSYHKLFALLHWINVWDEVSLNLLEKQLMDNVYRKDHGKFIFDTLRLRTGGIL